MEKRQYEYMLRYCMEPGLYEEERLANLLAFCRESGTTDVMFFYNCEELNRGHFTPEELELWLGLIARLKPLLAAEGITTSVNPWATVLHTDRGRTLRPGQDFTPMVDPHGRRAQAVACPACARFLSYLAWQYRTCAERIRPNVLWVEDDFRLHNHHPLEWGGCFCEKHMALFSERAGKALTREEFVRGLLAPGPAHPYRKIWLDVGLETMRRMAGTIRGAVMDASPDTRIGLMTSDPVAHAVEGRDWDAIFTAFKTRKDPYIRIHLPSYLETTAQNYGVAFACVSRQARHLAPAWAENYGELENFTFSRFSTSLAFTQMQAETNALLDGKGITLDIYDMMGNGVLPCEGYQRALAECKPFLDTLVNLGLDRRLQRGVGVMVDPNCVRSLQTVEGKSMSELNNRERNLMQVLVPFGVATRYDSGRNPRGGVLAVAGQYLRNLDEAEIRALFAENYVILDGEAVRTLADLGLGALAGVLNVETVPMDNGVNAYEQVADGVSYCGIAGARMTMQAGAGDFVRVAYAPGADVRVYTRAFSPFGADNGPAMAAVGGRVFVLPYENYGPAILNPYRRAVMLAALWAAEGVERPVWADAPHTTVIHYELPGRTLFAVVNFSGDDSARTVLTVPDGLLPWSRATLYARECPEGEPACLAWNGRDLVVDRALPRIRMMVLELVHG